MVGWLWYLGTLVPVIGLVQVGQQAMADRYTYIPQIGLSIIIAWSLAELFAIRPSFKSVVIALIFVVLGMFAIITKIQVVHWQNSINLNEHALVSTTENPLAHYNLAIFLSDQGRLDEATPHFAEALRLNPNEMLYNYGFGLNLDRQGQYYEAEKYYRMALKLDTNRRYAHELYVYLGVIQAKRGQLEEAADNFQESLRLDPENAPAFFLLGNAMLAQDKPEEAFFYFSEAVRINPRHEYAFCGLADVKVSQGRMEEAIGYLSEALRLSPEDPYIRSRLEFVRQSARP
jgi:tetratricopeptide (TPR) repeat protein